FFLHRFHSLHLSLFFFSRSRHPRHLHSFPTRRSSDLRGPVIIAPNHFSFMDHFFVAMFVRRRVQFMAKSQLFERPMQFIYTHGGDRKSTRLNSVTWPSRMPSSA